MNNALEGKFFKEYLELIRRRYQNHKELIKWTSEPESILELGIGNGIITKEVIFPLIPQNTKEYIGCDKFSNPLKTAIKTLDNEKFQTYMMDAATKNIPKVFKNKFHHIFSNNLFHHIQDTRQVLSNIMEMLKPGGQLFFTTFQRIFSDEAFEKLDEGKWSKYENRKAISPFYKSDDPVKEYENVIKSVGFVDCHIYTEHNVLRMTQDFFKDMIVFVNYRLPYVEEADKEEYVRDYTREVENGKLVEIINDEKTGEKLYDITFDTIYGTISKPL